MQIIDVDGNLQDLSDKVYVMKQEHKDSYHAKRYPLGTLFRLITGVNDSKIMGYHFNSKWVTVCPDGAGMALFLGVERDNLEEVK